MCEAGGAVEAATTCDSLGGLLISLPTTSVFFDSVNISGDSDVSGAFEFSVTTFVGVNTGVMMSLVFFVSGVELTFSLTDVVSGATETVKGVFKLSVTVGVTRGNERESLELELELKDGVTEISFGVWGGRGLLMFLSITGNFIPGRLGDFQWF